MEKTDKIESKDILEEGKEVVKDEDIDEVTGGSSRFQPPRLILIKSSKTDNNEYT